MTQALILAAGRGSRLGAVGAHAPKCLLDVGGRSLVERQMDVFREAGIREICVVIGFGAEHVRGRLEGECEYIYNGRYAATNSLYSLCLARRWVRGPLLIANCDVLADPIIYHRMLAAPGNAIAYDSSSGLDAEHMKVSVERGRVRRISKSLSLGETHGENLGILRFDEHGARSLFVEATKLIAAGHERAWAPAAVDALARWKAVEAIDVEGIPWAEIDFSEDVEHARSVVWPAICARRSAPGHVFSRRRADGPRAIDERRAAAF